ncbi:MAG: hypothetical protein HKN57_07520 [Xanthomonadales bacterium]|nr:hypothetical protein [Gammaproteobacteria bacterium]MBT8054033.1 hypothetical protein [Gammaproteobacteria bacterium]NND57084.1 hypothetical protein [Xanthomonadales bacterium]NNK51028.1 hypothetical protein [Xanthomonadales bacterium]
MRSWFRRYLLPGLVFQSICIAGGYGTGRELVEFFLQYGPVGGLLGMLPATLIVSATCMIGFELARMFRTYDYRSFLKVLLGRGWFIYEIAYLTAILLILAVIGSATGTVLTETFQVPGILGTIMLLGLIAFLAFWGTGLIENFLSAWSFILYGVYLGLFLLSIYSFGPAIMNAVTTHAAEPGWFLSGTRYGALQLALLPAILFATAHIKERREALIAGALAGPLLMIPAALFFFAMLAHYPAILERPVPVNYILQMLGSTTLLILFPIVLIGTFIETGTGMIHAFNERIAGGLDAIGKTLPDFARPIIAAALIVSALLLSRWGIIELIAVGYTAMTWVFIGIIVVPLLTIGLWKVARK